MRAYMHTRMDTSMPIGPHARKLARARMRACIGTEVAEETCKVLAGVSRHGPPMQLTNSLELDESGRIDLRLCPLF